MRDKQFITVGIVGARRAGRSSQGGFTIVELMIAMLLGLLVMLAATVMLLSARSTYRTQDEGTRLQENARFALDLVDRVVRTAGFTNFGNGTTDLPYFYTGTTPAPTNFVGINDCSTTSAGCFKVSTSHSDQLSVSFYGSDQQLTAGVADDTVLDCKGKSIPGNKRVTNTFYVAANPDDGEPELYCDNQDGQGPQALIRGVEDFQVLYGVAIYENGVYPPGTPPPAPTTDDNAPAGFIYKRADQMTTSALGIKDWDFVRFVRIGMLIRSAPGARTDQDITTYQVLGPNYTNTSADAGSAFTTTDLSSVERSRLRRAVVSTIAVRNRTSAWPNSGT